MYVSNFHEKVTSIIINHPTIKSLKQLAEVIEIKPSQISKYKVQCFNDPANLVHIPNKHIGKFIKISSESCIEFLDKTDNLHVWLDDAVSHSHDYIVQADNKSTSTGRYFEKLEAIDLLNKIKEKNINEVNLDFHVEGTLFPTLLLCPGWWDRKTNRDYTTNLDDCNDIQKWLFTGFEQWAPSWEVSLEMEKPWLLAQLAGQDEAESIALIIDKYHAENIRKSFYNKKSPLKVEVTGSLFHRRDLPVDMLLDNNEISTMVNDYCIVVRQENKNHNIKTLEESRFYTGYLWQCCIPEKIYENKKSPDGTIYPKISDVYMIWEHTQYGSKEAVEYNLHGLNEKKVFIEKYISDKLIVIQNSSIIVGNDEKILPKEMFFSSISKSIINKRS